MKKGLKLSIPILVILAVLYYLFSSSGMGKVVTDLTQAYADPELYNNAIEKANSNKEVIESIGEIKPIDKMTILNGEVKFSDDDQIIHSTVKITGSTRNGKLDLTAERDKESWRYQKISIRIKDSEEKNKTIVILNQP